MAAVFIRGMTTTEEELAKLTAELRELAPGLPSRIEANPDDIETGLARLVLTVVELLRQVMEHQAVRRMEGGALTEDEIEQLGLALMRLQERLEEIKTAFGLAGEELNIDLGPLGRLL
jgi:actin-like ATPase involved in cell morphogenesis